jgi:hypothetical protein
VALPGLTVSKFSLNAVPTDSTQPLGRTLVITKVTIRSVPTNITVRLGEMPPFWVRVGELSKPGGETSPDFAAALNTYLSQATAENGCHAIPFVVHSDTIARLEAELQIDYVLEQPILPSHLPEMTLNYGYGTLPDANVDLTTVTLPRAAMPVVGQSTAQVRGQFQPTRLAQEPPVEEPTAYLAEVSPQCSLAQAVQSDREVELIGIDLPLGKTEPGLSGLSVTLQGDDGGKPSGEVRVRAEVRVNKPLPGQSAWGSATLNAPFRILPKERSWLVLQSRDGKATWQATPADRAVAPAAKSPPLQCTRDGGLSWRAATAESAPGPLAARLQLRHQPQQFTMPVQVQIGKGPAAVRRRLDEFAPLGRIDFTFDLAETLTEHLHRPELASPCGAGELLVNGGFEEPPPDDATRRILGEGQPLGSGLQIQGTVDLSRGVDLSIERFIELQVSYYQSPDMVTITKRIDCAGALPAETTLEEIIGAINRAVERPVASKDGGERLLRIGYGTYDHITLFPWCKPEVPAAWRGQAGYVVRAEVSEHLIVCLAAPPNLLGDLSAGACPEGASSALDPLMSAEMCQRVRVGAGCSYWLRFLYAYPGSREGDEERVGAEPGRWQILWLDNAGKILVTNSMVLNASRDGEQESPLVRTVEALVTAPPGAVEAEIGFVQPPSAILALMDVSFTPALEALANGELKAWEDSPSGRPTVPVRWTRASGWIDPNWNQDSRRWLLCLNGNGPEDAILSQTVDILAGASYELEVSATPKSALKSDPETLDPRARARVEVRWLAGTSLGSPVLLPLDGRDFPRHAWRGVAPAGAKQAEIRIIQPKGTSGLVVQSVSLERIDQVEVPLAFLAEAPGELTVSHLRVVYDLPQEPELSLVETTDRVQREGFALSVVPAKSAARVAQVARPSPLGERPANILAGVGSAFAEILGRPPISVTTVAALAAFDPQASIAGIPPGRLLEIVTTAEMVMDLGIEARPLAALAGESPEALLAMTPAELAQRTGQSIALAEQAQRKLRALRLLIKNDVFRILKLSDVA